jgi:hypothetical protein
LIRHYAGLAGVTFRHESSADVVVAHRTGPAGELWIVTNLGSAAGHVTLPRSGHDIVGGAAVPAGALPLPTYGWRAVQLE